MAAIANPVQSVSASDIYARQGGSGGSREDLRLGQQGKAADRAAAGVTDSLELSPDAQKALQRLKTTDQKVRAHEAAHMAAGGGVVKGGASFSTTRGPDGKQYATGGEVAIDASPVPNNPRATLMKAQQIQAAAMAPADPSAQDRKVASEASRMAAQAAAEISKAAAAGPAKSQFDLMA